MKITITENSVRIRLSYAELDVLSNQSLSLQCEGFSWCIQPSSVNGSHMTGWPVAAILHISQRDLNDLQAEPENGIALSHLAPPVVLEVDKRDRPKQP